MTVGRSAGVKVCDDCGREYAGPAYYTFDSTACVDWASEGEKTPHVECTGNLCSECAGSDLEPDRADDPRRPEPS